MGRVLRWASVTLTRKRAELAWSVLSINDPSTADYIRRNIDESDGIFVTVEVPESDMQKILRAIEDDGSR
jgi:hypothetical protein